MTDFDGKSSKIPPKIGAAFLDALFGHAPEDLYFNVWTLPDKRSHWFRCGDIDKAAELVPQLLGKDVYVSVALAQHARGKFERVTVGETAGIVGLWADIDIRGEKHKSDKLPPALEDALRLVGEFPLAPTLVVHTGGGVHVWWLFHEPWIFENDADRDKAADLAERFQATLQAKA